ncbi:MAG TPA: hypothetical protein VLA10_07515, partial [Ilumatobacter sp.]|nr:hypothetical protein [Ilumatobacter sp.]
MNSLITNARLADGRLVDVTLAAGMIASVTPAGTADPASPGGLQGVDLGGWLLLPAMAEPHAHLDKALTAELVPNPGGDLSGAIEAWLAAASAGVFAHDDMVVRIKMAIDKLLLNGVTAIRSHINCGGMTGISHLVAAREAIAGYEQLIDIEFVALTHSPMVGAGSEPNRTALNQAIEYGADLVGGCPHL